jgi:phage gpG-like protein
MSTGAAIDAIESMLAALPAVTETATIQVALIAQREIQNQLRLTSHPKRTPTPSQPGNPPALVAGNLFRSITTVGPATVAGYVSMQVGPTMIYSRIQELGGMAGRGHLSKLPARPYVRPGVDLTIPQAEVVYLSAWGGLLGV